MLLCMIASTRPCSSASHIVGMSSNEMIFSLATPALMSSGARASGRQHTDSHVFRDKSLTE